MIGGPSELSLRRKDEMAGKIEADLIAEVGSLIATCSKQYHV